MAETAKTTITTDDIVRKMVEIAQADDKSITASEAREALNLFKAAVLQFVVNGDKVVMTGFLTFTPTWRNPRKGNNIVTNQPMDIPGGVVLSVKAGKTLKELVRTASDDVVEKVKAATK